MLNYIHAKQEKIELPKPWRIQDLEEMFIFSKFFNRIVKRNKRAARTQNPRFKDTRQRSEYAAGPCPHQRPQERQLLRANEPVTNAWKFHS